MGFHKTVMLISIVILVFALILIGVTLYKQKYSNDVKFPPVIADCPDYWKNISTDNKIMCENVKSLGSCPGVKDFSASEFSGTSGLCGKQKWAESCGVFWDGVTNNSALCDDT